MAEISVVNSNTVMKRIRDYAIIGLVGLTLWNAPKVADRVTNYFEQKERKAKFEELLEKKSFDAASELLEEYSKHKSLEQIDIATLKINLKEAKKTSKIKSLDSLVESKKYDEAKKEIAALKKEGILTKDEIEGYEGKIDQLSKAENEKKPLKTILENIQEEKLYLKATIENIRTSSGENKIRLIDAFIANNPQDPRINELKIERINSYISIMDLYFLKGNSSLESTRKKVDDFYTWIKKQEPAFVKEADFSNLERSWREYITTTLKEIRQGKRIVEYIKGEKAVIIKKLEGNSYSFKKTPSYIPIGQRGIYYSKEFGPTLEGMHAITLINEEGDKMKTYWFRSGEFEKLGPSTIENIYYKMKEIETYYKQIKNDKLEK